MLDEERSPKDILLQFRSVKSGMHKAEQLLLDEVFRKTLAIQLVKTMDACPGDCGNEERIEVFRKEFPDLKLEELAGKMEGVNSLNQWLQEYLKKKKKAKPGLLLKKYRNLQENPADEGRYYFLACLPKPAPPHLLGVGAGKVGC